MYIGSHYHAVNSISQLCTEFNASYSSLTDLELMIIGCRFQKRNKYSNVAVYAQFVPTLNTPIWSSINREIRPPDKSTWIQKPQDPGYWDNGEGLNSEYFNKTL